MAIGVKTGGRQKGTPNKVNGLLKDAILAAADQAGGEEGVMGYLKVQAVANPVAFMGLLGRVLPLQVTGENGGSIKVDSRFEIVLVPGVKDEG